MAFHRIFNRPLYLIKLSNQKGTALLLVIVRVVIGSIVVSSFVMTSRVTHKNSGQKRVNVTALNIAEAGKESILAQLRNRTIKPAPQETLTVFSNKSFGSGSYTDDYITNTRNDTIVITSTAIFQKDTVKIEIVALLTPSNWRNCEFGTELK